MSDRPYDHELELEPEPELDDWREPELPSREEWDEVRYEEHRERFAARRHDPDDDGSPRALVAILGSTFVLEAAVVALLASMVDPVLWKIVGGALVVLFVVAIGVAFVEELVRGGERDRELERVFDWRRLS